MSSMDPIMTKLEYGLELCRCLNPYCLNHHELANLQKFGGMVNSIMNEACGKHAQLEILVFYYGWCPTRTTDIMVGSILTSNFLYIFTS
jgi:hypothetical protein